METNEEMTVKSWEKVYDNAAKTGFREGIQAAKDSTFQKFFDLGYAEGFKNGFALGQYKGLLKGINCEDELLEKTTRGNCELCKDEESLLTKSTPDVIKLQTDSTKHVLETLNTKYSQKLSNCPTLK